MITVYHSIFSELPKPELLSKCMRSVERWADVNGYNYKCILHNEEDLELTGDLRYHGDYVRIKDAIDLAPCIYFDWDILLNDGFKITNTESVMFGSPVIAMFYLPNSSIAVRTVDMCDIYKKENGFLPDNYVSNTFESLIMFDRNKYLHYNWHKIVKLGRSHINGN